MTNNSRDAMTEFLDWHQVRHRKTATTRARQYVLMTLASLLILSGCERWSLDRQMEALCKRDGGIKVYETVTLPASEFSDIGQPLARYIPIAKSDEDYLGPDYRYVRTMDVVVGKNVDIETGKGRITRFHSAVYRRSDGHLLGELISYGRGGGDGFTFGFNPSGNACPLPRIDLIKSVFVKGK